MVKKGEVPEEGATAEMPLRAEETTVPAEDRDVQPSTNLLFLRSTIRSKCDRKSAPKMGWVTSELRIPRGIDGGERGLRCTNAHHGQGWYYHLQRKEPGQEEGQRTFG